MKLNFGGSGVQYAGMHLQPARTDIVETCKEQFNDKNKLISNHNRKNKPPENAGRYC